MLTSSPSTHGFQPGLRGYGRICTPLASVVGWEEATSVTTGGTAGPRNKDAHVPYPLTQAELDPSVLPAEDGSGSPAGAVAVGQISVHGACQKAPGASPHPAQPHFQGAVPAATSLASSWCCWLQAEPPGSPGAGVDPTTAPPGFIFLVKIGVRSAAALGLAWPELLCAGTATPPSPRQWQSWPENFKFINNHR